MIPEIAVWSQKVIAQGKPKYKLQENTMCSHNMSISRHFLVFIHSSRNRVWRDTNASIPFATHGRALIYSRTNGKMLYSWIPLIALHAIVASCEEKYSERA